MVNIIKISIVILMTGLLVFLSGCEKQPETKKQTTVPVIVSGVILSPPSVKTEEKSIPKPGIIGPAKTNQVPNLPKKVSKTEAVKIVKVPAGVVTEELLKREQVVAGSLSVKFDTLEAVASYNSKGKLNPFLPLIQEKNETGSTSPVVDEKPKRILTPLEKLDLGQIKLVAVILMKNRQLAMVEETTGKGYEVRIGTYMGKNRGQVSKINQSSIVVKEYLKDYKGKLQVHFQEIKLHKKESGE